MRKGLKALHLIGVAMFLGSILAHISVGLIPGVQTETEAALFARQAISAATLSVTLPGLGLMLLTGAALYAKGGLRLGGRRWLLLHAGAGALIALNAALVLAPTGREPLGLAEQAAAGGGAAGPGPAAGAAWARLHALEAREALFGAVNVTLALAAIAIAVVKPRLGARRTPTGS